MASCYLANYIVSQSQADAQVFAIINNTPWTNLTGTTRLSSGPSTTLVFTRFVNGSTQILSTDKDEFQILR